LLNLYHKIKYIFNVDKLMKILTVDDNEQMRNLLKMTFSHSPEYQLFQAENSASALQLVQEFEPDVAFLDIMMPGDLDGYGLCKQIKAINKTCFVVFLSVKAAQDDIDLGVQAGADRYLTKPFSPFKLIQLVEDFQKLKTNEAIENLQIKLSTFSPINETPDIYHQLSGFFVERLLTLQMMLGSKEAVLASIKHFMNDFSVISIEISDLLAQTEFNLALEKLHSLKGAAANVGANDIANLAAEIEVIVQNGSDFNQKMSALLEERKRLEETTQNLIS
jgi:two-component system, OmpR family, phosphate regulon response regulator PhoB